MVAPEAVTVSVGWFEFLGGIIAAIIGGSFTWGVFRTYVNASIKAHADALKSNDEEHKEIYERMRELEAKQRDEVMGLRADINGMGIRFSDAIQKSEDRIAQRIEGVARGFESQSRLLMQVINGKSSE